MKSRKICNTTIETVGKPFDDVVTIRWNIGNGHIHAVKYDGVSYRHTNVNRINSDSITWTVPVSLVSLDKVIAFLQKVGKDAKKNMRKS